MDGEDVAAAERKYGLLSTLLGLLQAESKTLQQVTSPFHCHSSSCLKTIWLCL
jgi:hypothetical protein